MATVCIIGGGVAGLTAGIVAAEGGLHCVLLEKNRTAGGNLTGWDRRGYHIDNCIHWLTGTRPGTALYDLWERVGALGEGIELYRGDAFYTVYHNRRRLSMWRDPDRTLADMCFLSPADTAEVKRFIAAVKVFADPAAGKAAKAAVAARYAPLSLDRLARKFVHPLLQLAMTDYIPGEFSAIALITAYAAFCGGNGDIPRGGSLPMAERMAARFTALGGELHTGKTVSRILLRGDRAVGAVTDDGTVYEADYILCCCDPAITFGRLLDRSYMPRRLSSLYRREKTFPLWSALHTAHLCTATEPGVSIIDAIPFNAGDGRRTRLVVRSYAHEAGSSHDGKTVVQTMIPLHREAARNWIALSRDPDAYAAAKRRLTDTVGQRLSAWRPDWDPEPLDCWTPATYHRYFGAPCGSFMSFGLTNRSFTLPVPQKIPRLKNVFLATQWESPPGGLPTAARAGERAAQHILSME